MDLINSATFLNTLIDFTEPGQLGVFTDEASIRRLEKTMKRTGFLPKEEMQRSFNLLRTNDLIWNYAVSSWLMGEEPPAFDLLSWNNDSTRMPAEMHSFYLRSCYVGNELARGVMELAGQRLDLEKVDLDLYFLSAEQDHIAPWRSSYAGALLPGGNVRFVLSNSGHIAGIVNPPSPKSIHHVLEGDKPLPESPDDWLKAATVHPVTWWEDWAPWIGDRAGRMRKPPRMGNRKYRPITDAPGTYVLET
jgi:polyhydroxyalkanoate synthase